MSETAAGTRVERQAFDSAQRNALAKMVGRARERLKVDLTDQLRRLGFQDDGTVLELDRIAGLDEGERAAGVELRALLEHFVAAETSPPGPLSTGGGEGGTGGGRGRKRGEGDGAARVAAYARLLREIGFTTFNRLIALRMAEERGLIVQSVGGGLGSTGFQVYEQVANGALGSRAETYRAYVESLYDELAVDLPALFDRANPESWIFPSERCLEDVLALIDAEELTALWREDEAIGWVYQYYNDPAERKRMRDESSAPRNSRELAVRNQFFTPRYVVEFLTDNTLGRLWYEMRQGETRLRDDCRYLVQRKHPVFLAPGEEPPRPYQTSDGFSDPDLPGEMWVRPNPDHADDVGAILSYALTAGGYDYARKNFGVECGEFANERKHRYFQTKRWDGSFDELRCCLFFEQRRYHHFGEMPKGEELEAITALFRAICDHWDLEVEHISFRARKDPRDLKILDPASGSGHFLLYAFDLLQTIYGEAWDDPKSPRSEAAGATLRGDYRDRDALGRAIPGLILKHNLHGIEIDPRCLQVSGMALWLRAQRAFKTLNLKAADRPPITESHLVLAEPMPGEPDLLKDYVAETDRRLHQLVEAIWEKMKLAGDAGSLLKIEEEIGESVRKAREDALADDGLLYQHRLLGPGVLPSQLALPLVSDDERSFWAEAEGHLIDALRDYASRLDRAGATRRRLFRNDAVRGLAFVDVCRVRFDVALMNPPFGECTTTAANYVRKAYRETWKDLYAAFLERCTRSIASDGFIGCVSSSLFLYTKQLRSLRAEWITDASLPILVELGAGVLDGAAVETALTVTRPDWRYRTAFIDLTGVESSEKETGLYREIVSPGALTRHHDISRFKDLESFPFCYHLSEKKLLLWEAKERLDPDVGTVVAGNATFHDERFLRLRWEVRESDIGGLWVSYEKGGDYQPYFSPTDVLIKWGIDGSEVRQHQIQFNGTDAQVMQSQSFWRRTGITYPRVSSIGFGPRYLPEGHIFSSGSISIFPVDDADLFALLAFLASTVAQDLLYAYGRYRKIEGRAVSNIPIPKRLLRMNRERLTELAVSNIRMISELEEWDETSPLFYLPEDSLEVLAGRLRSLGQQRERIAFALKGLAEQTDVAINMLLFDGTEEGLAAKPRSELVDRYAKQSVVDLQARIVESWLSYFVGSVIGRWDIRAAVAPTSDSRRTSIPGRLPRHAPGALTEYEDPLPVVNRHAVFTKSAYPFRISRGDILVDDPDQREDIVGRVREVLALLWPSEDGSRAQAIEYEACEILGVADLREYFRKSASFFANHLKQYSKSRRQAPIYWPLSTASGSYTLWVYYHRLTSDTLYIAVNRFVGPKLAEVERTLGELEGKLATASGREATRLRAEADAAMAFLGELRDFREELLRVAALPYRPDLNDGVIINAAPLHKLFRLPKWAKDTRECWEKLQRGDYDWAHLAYTIWPERVREKCRSDRSLAIAHDLEQLYEKPATPAKGARVPRDVDDAEEGDE